MKMPSILILILFIISCKPDSKSKTLEFSQDQLYGTWKLTEVKFTDAYRAKTDTIDRRKITGTIGQGHFLNFFSDKTATRLVDNHMDYLSLNRMNDSTYFIKNLVHEKVDTLITGRLSENKGYTFIEFKTNDHGIYKYVKFYKAFDDPLKDPYHAEHNQWRIAATEFESRNDVLKRLSNYIKHKSLLMASSENRENKKIRLKNSEGILRIYDGGLGLKDEETLPKNWLHKYYSDSQGINAYKHLNKHFDNGIIKYNSQKSWMQKNYEILDSLHQLIESEIR